MKKKKEEKTTTPKKSLKKQKDTNSYPIKEAIKKVKADKKRKFDSTVELHINLDIDPTKQNIRFSASLPHGTGKTKKVAVLASTKAKDADLFLSESDLPKFESGKLRPKVDFDVLVTEPKFMPILAKYARILGPAGVMPNPKNGTVSENIDKAVEQIKKGRTEIKIEKLAPIIHTIIGKVSFDEIALEENFLEVMNGLKKNKPPKTNPIWIKSAYLSSSMGSSVKVTLEE